MIEAPIELGGKPEYLAADGAGKVYLNLEDKDQVAVVDLKTRKVLAHWPVAPGGSPVGLAIECKPPSGAEEIAGPVAAEGTGRPGVSLHSVGDRVKSGVGYRSGATALEIQMGRAEHPASDQLLASFALCRPSLSETSAKGNEVGKYNQALTHHTGTIFAEHAVLGA